MNLIEARKTLDVFMANKGDSKTFEIRTTTKIPLSGYFNDVDTAMKAIARFSNETFYIIMNDINKACSSREQADQIINGKMTTSDAEIVGIRWILIDIDPIRVRGVSSSDDEKLKAKEKAKKIMAYLSNVGFEDPIIADSGNGYHLLYRVELFNNAEVVSIIKEFLQALAMLFTDESCDIDRSVFNPARITKLYGCTSNKGKSTLERPFRESKIIKIPEEIKKTSITLLQKVCSVLPKQEAPTYKNNYNSSKNTFNIRKFISDHNIKVASEVPYGEGVKLILEECPFDNSHKAPDSTLFINHDGSIGFKCLHASCSNKTWQDVREFYEPGIYQKKILAVPNYKNDDYKSTQIMEDTIDTSLPAFLTSEMIRAMPKKERVIIKTGITVIDTYMQGLAKGEISVLSGLSGSGKTSLISELALNIIQQGYRVALFSGELSCPKTLAWITKIAAGKNYVTKSKFNESYYVRDGIQDKISKWLDEKLYIYNNDYGNEFKKLCERLNECVRDKKVDFVILDNLAAMDISKLDMNPNEAQKKFINYITWFAKRNDIHLLFVAHPRKSADFLRIQDISGTSDLRNLVDNGFILHRVNSDFKRLSKTMFNWKETNDIYSADNVLEIAKDRENGIQDMFVKLYFDIPSKRLKNDRFENTVYGWNDDLTSFDYDELPF